MLKPSFLVGQSAFSMGSFMISYGFLFLSHDHGVHFVVGFQVNNTADTKPRSLHGLFPHIDNVHGIEKIQSHNQEW
jgi:hypothetical protein